MNRQEVFQRLDTLCREYNDLSSQLSMLDIQGPKDNVPIQPSSTNKNAEYEAAISKLKLENKEQKKEIKFLKDQLKRCNEHLNSYFERQGDVSFDVYKNESDDASISRQNVYKLNGLLLAYDEVIKEQEVTIIELRSSVKNSFKQMKILEEENNKFHEAFKIFNLETYNEGDLLEIAEEAKLLMEGREQLLSEIALLKQKEAQTKETYGRRAENLELQLQKERGSCKILQDRLIEIEKALEDQQLKGKELQQKLQQSVAEEAHKKSINKCYRYLDELKDAYGSESTTMKKNVDEIKVEKTNLEQQLNKSNEKLQGVKREAFGYKTHIRKTYSQINHQKNLIRSLKLSRSNIQTKLRNLCGVCSKLLEDRKRIIKELHELRLESRKFSLEATNKSEIVGRLTLKYKENHLGMVQKLAECDGKRKAAEEAWSKALKDISRLKRLLQSKEEALQAVLQDLRVRMTSGNI